MMSVIPNKKDAACNAYTTVATVFVNCHFPSWLSFHQSFFFPLVIDSRITGTTCLAGRQPIEHNIIRKRKKSQNVVVINIPLNKNSPLCAI